MIQTDKLRGLIAENKMSQAAFAAKLGMNPHTFYKKMDRGVFDSDEIYQMIDILKIEEPATIFFAREGA